MTEVARLDVFVGFTDKATSGLKSVSNQFDKTSSKISKSVGSISTKFVSLGKNITTLAAKFTMLAGVAGIAAVGLAAKSAISTFTDFEKAIANAIQEKMRSAFRSLLRKNISRWNKPREKQMLPTNTNAKEKRLIKTTLLHYQML